MTTHTALPAHRIGTRNVTLGLAAAALAAAAAYGVAVLAFDQDAVEPAVRGDGTGQVGSAGQQHPAPSTFTGTDREWRVQLHGR